MSMRKTFVFCAAFAKADVVTWKGAAGAQDWTLGSNWSTGNPTVGQCSITAFLAQDIFGGQVWGILRPGGTYHCFNIVKGVSFDLTSEQFGVERLDYLSAVPQSRDVHFEKEEKLQRYLTLKAGLEKALGIS